MCIDLSAGKWVFTHVHQCVYVYTHFPAFTPRNHVSPRVGVERVSIYSAQDLPCCDCSTEGDDVSIAHFLPRHFCPSCSRLCPICAGGAPWKPLSSWCCDEWFYLLDLGRIQGSFTLRLTHQISCSPKAAITKMPRTVEWTFGV